VPSTGKPLGIPVPAAGTSLALRSQVPSTDPTISPTSAAGSGAAKPAPPSAPAVAFYRRAMAALEQAGVPFLVGGAYAFAHYTGIVRDTKDFDLFILPADLDAALATLGDAGYPVERKFPHWLGKAHGDDGSFVDLIFGSGNGLTPVDGEWFHHAVHAEVIGVPVRLCPAEEMLWSKSFIMERERFDGADVAHLLHSRAEVLDWRRLLQRFGEHWRVLLSHLALFGYIYPADAGRIPPAVLQDLLGRMSGEIPRGDGAAVPGTTPPGTLCRGTVLSRAQYLFDLETRGYLDARLPPTGVMSPGDVALWTAAIEEDGDPRPAPAPAPAVTAPPADPPDR